MSSDVSAFSGLVKALNDLIPPEFIDGNDVTKVAEMVDLEIAFSPVLHYAMNGDPAKDYCGHIPKPVRVEKELDRYCIVNGQDFRWVGADTIKRMRARYLLVRGYYAGRLENDTLSHSERQTVLCYYFPDGFLNLKKLRDSKGGAT